MAGNSSIYNLRQQVNQTNIEKWQKWSSNINYVVSQFNDVIENLTDRLEFNEMTIDALSYKIANPDTTYIKLQYDSIQTMSSNEDVTYTKSCGVYSARNDSEDNVVYVYSNVTLPGLYFDDSSVKLIIENENQTRTYKPFTSFSGTDSGTQHKIKTNRAQKLRGNINLYFSFSPRLTAPFSEFVVDASNAKLPISITYSGVTLRQPYIIDESALSKALIKNVPISTDTIPVEKLGVAQGQFSTSKTLANIVNNQ